MQAMERKQLKCKHPERPKVKKCYQCGREPCDEFKGTEEKAISLSST